MRDAPLASARIPKQLGAREEEHAPALIVLFTEERLDLRSMLDEVRVPSFAVASKTTDLDACYVSARKASAALKATTVELTFTIEADGTVSGVRAKAKNKDFGTCVRDVVKLVKMDKPLVSTKTKAVVVISFGS